MATTSQILATCERQLQQLNDRSTSDVTLVVQGTPFYAHQSVLCESCQYFQELLNGQLRVFSRNASLEVEINNCTVEVFEIVINFIYTQQLSFASSPVSQIWEVMEVAMLYGLHQLQLIAETALASMITSRTVCSLWLMAMESGSERLSGACSDFFMANLDKCIKEPTFDHSVLALLPPTSLGSVPPELLSNAVQTSVSMLHKSTLNPPQPPAAPLSQLSSEQADAQIDKLFDDSVLFDDTEFDLQLFPDLPPNPFIALSSTFGSLDQALPQPQPKESTTHASAPVAAGSSGTVSTTSDKVTTASSSGSNSDSSNHQTLRQGDDVAARMPLLQGPIWWQTVEQLRVLLESMRKTCKSDLCTLFLYDDVAEELYGRIKTANGIECEIALPSNLGVAGAAFTSRKIICADSPYDDKRFYSGIDEQLGARTRALLAAPIITALDSRPIGVIEVLNTVTDASFTEANKSEIEFVARMAAALVETALDRVKATVALNASAIQERISELNATQRVEPSALDTQQKANDMTVSLFTAPDPFLPEPRRFSSSDGDFAAAEWVGRRISSDVAASVDFDESSPVGRSEALSASNLRWSGRRRSSMDSRKNSGGLFFTRRFSNGFANSSGSVLGKRRESTTNFFLNSGPVVAGEQSQLLAQHPITHRRKRLRTNNTVFHFKPKD